MNTVYEIIRNSFNDFMSITSPLVIETAPIGITLCFIFIFISLIIMKINIKNIIKFIVKLKNSNLL